MTKIYTITGSSKVAPAELPEGFTVETETVPLDLRLDIFQGRRLRIKASDYYPNGGVHMILEATYGGTVMANLKRSDVVAIRDALNEHLEDTGLRAWQVDDHFVWWEIEKDWFVTADSREEARKLAGDYEKGQGFGITGFESLKSSYSQGKLIQD